MTSTPQHPEDMRKRRRSGSPPEECRKIPSIHSSISPPEENRYETESSKPRNRFPRFFLIEGTDSDHPMSLNTPTKGNLILKGLIGTVEKVIRLSNGDLIVGLQREGQMNNLLGITLFGVSPCKVSSYDRMNTKKGVIRCPAFKGISEKEIVEDLTSEGVVAAKKLFYKRDGLALESATVILTFDSSVLPKEIKAGYLNIKVEAYIPNPLRCFQCNRFGHPKDRCKRKACCARCGSLEHTSDKECNKQPHCVNCEGGHSSFSKDCPKWKEEKEIQRIRTTQNISFHQARQQVAPTPAPGHLFSDVIRRKVQTSEAETQTDPADYSRPQQGTSTSHHRLSESDSDIVPPTPKPNTNTPPTQTTTNKSLQRNLSSQYTSRADTKNLSKSQKKRQRQQALKNALKGSTDQALDQLEAMDVSVTPCKGARSPVKPP
jgi:hypothetical protein